MAIRALLSVVVLAFFLPTAVPAQPIDSGRDRYDSGEVPAHLSVVEGEVSLQREGRIDSAAAGMLIVVGDRLRTDRGRAELIFGDGSLLHADEATVLDLLDSALLRLVEGQIRLKLRSAITSDGYRVDTPGGRVEIRQAGEYRLQLTDGVDLQVAVISGAALLVTDAGIVTLRAGEYADARAGQYPSAPRPFNSALASEFDRWVLDHLDARASRDSARYLPHELRPYAGVLDRYGTWRHESSYGFVWYPHPVSRGWRPFFHGHWSHVPRIGFAWVGADPWIWPTHFFGRWDMRHDAWFWIPGRRFFSAPVAWAVGPGFVAWSPLGIHGRPLISFTDLSFRTRGGFGRHDPSHAWIIVPSHVLRGRGRVDRHAIPWHGLDPRVRSAFSMRPRPPLEALQAVPRAAASDARAARPVAVPRGSSVVGAESEDPRSLRLRGAPPRTSAPPAGVRHVGPPRSPAAAAPADIGAPRRPTAVPRRESAQPSPYDRARRVMEQRSPAPSTAPATAPAGAERSRAVPRHQGVTLYDGSVQDPAGATRPFRSVRPSSRTPSAAPPQASPSSPRRGYTAPARAPEARPTRAPAAPQRRVAPPRPGAPPAAAAPTRRPSASAPPAASGSSSRTRAVPRQAPPR
jgi:hypothetical protein